MMTSRLHSHLPDTHPLHIALQNAFTNAYIEVIDCSSKHQHHMEMKRTMHSSVPHDMPSHIHIYATFPNKSSHFSHKQMLHQHRMVNDAMHPFLLNGLHSFQLTLHTA